MPQKIKHIGFTLLLVSGLLITLGLIYLSTIKAPIPEAYKNTGGPFTLQSSQGTFSLSDWQGKVVLLYFGYTHCPDKCPITLANWASAFQKLSAKELKQVGGLLITVDPKRDTPEHLQTYVSRFHPNIRGLTGSEAVLQKVALQYRADFEVAPEGEHGHDHHTSSTPKQGEIINHTSFVYLIGQEGKVRAMLPHNTRSDKLLAAIRHLL